MPAYKVSSGELTATVETPFEAGAREVAIVALAANIAADYALGLLTEISGGQFVGDNITYVSTEAVLVAMGYMAPNTK